MYLCTYRPSVCTNVRVKNEFVHVQVFEDNNTLFNVYAGWRPVDRTVLLRTTPGILRPHPGSTERVCQVVCVAEGMARWYARQKCSVFFPRVHNLRIGLTLVLMLLFLHPCCVRRTIIVSLFPHDRVHFPTIFLAYSCTPPLLAENRIRG